MLTLNLTPYAPQLKQEQNMKANLYDLIKLKLIAIVPLFGCFFFSKN